MKTGANELAKLLAESQPEDRKVSLTSIVGSPDDRVEVTPVEVAVVNFRKS